MEFSVSLDTARMEVDMAKAVLALEAGARRLRFYPSLPRARVLDDEEDWGTERAVE